MSDVEETHRTSAQPTAAVLQCDNNTDKKRVEDICEATITQVSGRVADMEDAIPLMSTILEYIHACFKKMGAYEPQQPPTNIRLRKRSTPYGVI